MLVKNAINHYLDNHIKLSQKNISEAAKSREWFLTRVENVINSRTGEPKLYPVEGQKFVYFGSFFKGTKVLDVDEYDVLVVIDSNNGFFSRSGEKLALGKEKLYLIQNIIKSITKMTILVLVHPRCLIG